MRFKNKVVVITGGGSGIGRACALEFAKQGSLVVVADINLEAALETKEQMNVPNGMAIAHKTDVSQPASVEELTQVTIKNFSEIHALVNNAAIQINKTIAETSFEEWNRQVAVNLGGVFLCSKYFLPHLLKTKGSIINMASVNGFFVEPGCAGYCATKSAIIGFTKAMAIDHGKDGIRVNCISPGYIDAGLAEGFFQSQPDPGSARKEAGKLHALWRIGRPEEVAKAALFLASEDSSFVTGTNLIVDGGLGSGLPPK
jgi:NAD(P)-dependent dehydrogenase (short-subunit alcohol dehydrogenase family)